MSTLTMSRSMQDAYREQTAKESPVTYVTRHCTKCGLWKSPIGGASVAIAHSKRRAWSCAGCCEVKP